MFIKKLRVSNFKSFNDLEVDFGHFNVLIGANASGKSNLVQVLRFLRDIEAFGLDNAISLQGGIEYIKNLNIGFDDTLSISVVANFDSYPGTDSKVGTLPFFDSKAQDKLIGAEIYQTTYEFSLQFYKRRLGFKISKDTLTQKCKLIEFTRKGTKKGSESLKKELGDGTFVFSITNGKIRSRVDVPDGVPLNMEPLMFSLFMEEFPSRTLLLEHSVMFLPLFGGRLDFSSISIYDFDPKLPKKATPITGKADLEEDGSNLAIVLKNIIADKNRKRKLDNLVKALLPFVRDLDVEKFADKSLLFKLLEVYSEKTYLPASLISDGTINITALLVALYFESKSVTIIEEPERNIHPHLISKVVDMMKDASQNKQVILSTHNPEIVRHANLNDILLVSRDKDGYSRICRPVEQEAVKIFLENEMGIDELYVDNLLEGCDAV